MIESLILEWKSILKKQWNFFCLVTLAIAFVRRPVILRQMLAASDEDAGS